VPLVPESVVVIILQNDLNCLMPQKKSYTLKRLLSFRSSKDVRQNLRTDILFILKDNFYFDSRQNFLIIYIFCLREIL